MPADALASRDTEGDPGCAPGPSGLVAWWDGDFVQGDRARDIKGGNDGTIKGGVKLVPGMVGLALEFDGGPGVIEVPDAPALSPRSGLTLEAWVQPYSHVIAARIVGKQVDDSVTASSYVLGIFGDSGDVGEVYFALFTNGMQTLTRAGAKYPIRKWSHVAATWDGREMRSYLDGQLQEVVAFARPYVVTREPLRIGKGDTSKYGFSGLIDEVTL